MKRAPRTENRFSQRWFSWIAFLAVPVAVSFGSPQDFRSPLILSPYSVSFGEVQAGKPTPPQAVTIVNTSDTAVHITNIAVTGKFTQTNNCPAPPASLAKNDSCQIQIVFDASAAERFSGTLAISHDADGSPLTVGLTGTGALGGWKIEISPSSLNFPAQRTGTLSAAQSVTVSNSGTKPLLISDIEVSGDFTIMPKSTCESLAGPLPVSSNCTIVVTFTPLDTGKRAGRVTVTDNAEDSPQTIQLAGTGLGNGSP